MFFPTPLRSTDIFAMPGAQVGSKWQEDTAMMFFTFSKDCGILRPSPNPKTSGRHGADRHWKDVGLRNDGEVLTTIIVRWSQASINDGGQHLEGSLTVFGQTKLGFDGTITKQQGTVKRYGDLKYSRPSSKHRLHHVMKRTHEDSPARPVL